MPDSSDPVRRSVLPQPAKPVSVDIAEALSSGSRSSGPMLTRDQILDAAVACLDEGGYDGLTIRNLATRLGCAVGTMYRYFDDKHELLVQCGNRLMQPVLEALDENPADFHQSVDRYINAAESDPELYQIMFWLPRRQGRAEVPVVIGTIIDRWAALLGDSIEARRRFAAIHGQLTLGERPGIAIDDIAPSAPEPSPAQAPESDDITLL